MEHRIGQRFRVRRRIGSGSFGDIYSGENVETHEEVAIKFEKDGCQCPQLSNEVRTYRALAGGVGIPEVKWYGSESGSSIMVMDLLGKSVEDLFVARKRSFSLKTILMLADQMITRIEYLHNKGFIHRDIKPNNFVIGLGKSSNQLFLIDLGLAKAFIDKRTGNHIQYREGRSLTGTARYVSINVHLGIEQSRRDDLEGIAYVLIYLMKGSLPWQGISAPNKQKKFELIGERKLSTTPEILCNGLPDEFAIFLKEVQKLEFNDSPNYSRYRRLFRDLMIKEGLTYDYKYDWETYAVHVPLVFSPIHEPEKRRAIESAPRPPHPRCPGTSRPRLPTNPSMPQFLPLSKVSATPTKKQLTPVIVRMSPRKSPRPCRNYRL